MTRTYWKAPNYKDSPLNNVSILMFSAAVFSDEYRILVDMRWNKQYLDILASKCNFEDEERYMDFLEALNTVANRYVSSNLTQSARRRACGTKLRLVCFRVQDCSTDGPRGTFGHLHVFCQPVAPEQRSGDGHGLR